MPGKIRASIDKDDEYDAIVAEFFHSQSKRNACQECRVSFLTTYKLMKCCPQDLRIMNSHEQYPDLKRAFNFLQWATTRYFFSTIRLCLTVHIILFMEKNCTFRNWSWITSFLCSRIPLLVLESIPLKHWTSASVLANPSKFEN